MTARPVLFVLLVLLGSPLAQASLLEQWVSASQPEVVVPSGEGNETLQRLRDVDGDGADEVLRVRQSPSGVDVAALGGPGLDREAWGLRLDGHWFWGMVPDQDGDGHEDLAVATGQGRYGGTGEGVPFASAGTRSYRDEARLTTRAGVDGATLGAFDETFAYDDAHVLLYPLVTFVYASKDTYASNATLFLEDQRLRFEAVFDGLQTWSTAGGFGHGGERLDVAVVDASGGELGRASFGGDGRSVVGGGFAEVDGGGLVDVAVLESVQPVPGVDGGPAVASDVLTVVSGRDAGVVWSVEGGPGLQDSYRYVEVLGVGDLDGDGRGELALHEYGGDGLRFTLRSGADGAVLRDEVGGDGFATALGDVDGDGAAEYLWVTYGRGLALSARGLDGVDRWSVEFSDYVDPVVDDFMDVYLGRWTDWTLDGVPDLLLREDGRVVLVDGSDGSLVFDHGVGDRHGVRPVADLTGDDGPDLLVVGLTDEDGDPASEDDSNVTLRLEVLRGRDGAAVWSSRDGSLDGGVRAYARGIGDVDGDGFEDVLVEVAPSCCEFECDDADCVARPVEMESVDEPRLRAVIHGGLDGRVLWRDGAVPPRDAPRPVVEPGAAFLGAVGEEEPTPLPAWTLAVALAAAVAVRRRR